VRGAQEKSSRTGEGGRGLGNRRGRGIRKKQKKKAKNVKEERQDVGPAMTKWVPRCTFGGIKRTLPQKVTRGDFFRIKKKGGIKAGKGPGYKASPLNGTFARSYKPAEKVALNTRIQRRTWGRAPERKGEKTKNRMGSLRQEKEK